MSTEEKQKQQSIDHILLALEVTDDITIDLLPHLGPDLVQEIYCKLSDIIIQYDEQSLMRLAKEIILERRKRRNGIGKASLS